jgi:hypothetical protein
MNLNPFGTSTERCLSELRKLQQARGRLEAEVTADRARLDQLRASLADEELASLLDGEDAELLRREIGDLERRIAGRLQAKPKLIRADSRGPGGTGEGESGTDL